MKSPAVVFVCQFSRQQSVSQSVSVPPVPHLLFLSVFSVFPLHFVSSCLSIWQTKNPPNCQQSKIEPPRPLPFSLLSGLLLCTYCNLTANYLPFLKSSSQVCPLSVGQLVKTSGQPSGHPVVPSSLSSPTFYLKTATASPTTSDPFVMSPCQSLMWSSVALTIYSLLNDQPVFGVLNIFLF